MAIVVTIDPHILFLPESNHWRYFPTQQSAAKRVLKESVKVPPGICQAGEDGKITVVTGETSKVVVPIMVTILAISSQIRFLLESNHLTYLPVPQSLSIFVKYF